MKVIFAGLEGCGKSLKLAKVAQDLVKRNAKWGKQIGKPRPIWSNLEFSKAFEVYAQEQGVPIKYWQNLDDLIKIDNADVILDEVGNYFDSRGWENLSLDARRWLTQGSKCGIEIYGSAQDFAQVDKAFRRLVNQLFEIRKVLGSRRPAATKPPVKRIWGVCLAYGIDPQGYKEDEKKYEEGFLSWIPQGIFFIRKRDCEIFDTSQKIVRSKPPAFRHEARYCQHHDKEGGDGSCTFCRVNHF